MRGHVFHGPALRHLRRDVAGEDIRAFADALDYSWRHIQMIETSGRQPSDRLARCIRERLSRLLARPVSQDELSTPADDIEAAA